MKATSKWAAIVAIAGLTLGLGLVTGKAIGYSDGHTAGIKKAQRTCPKVEQGERLISSITTSEGATCNYGRAYAMASKRRAAQ